MDNLWRPVRDRLRAYRAQIRLCLRMTVAGLLALAVVERFPFPLHGLWTVLTAVVVTQASVGGSLRATIEYMLGTLGGAITPRRSACSFPTRPRLRRLPFSRLRSPRWRLWRGSIRAFVSRRFPPCSCSS